MSDPIRAATMPIKIVSQIGMSWRPGSTSRPRAPMMSPTTMALMIPPIFVQLPNFILIRDLGLLNTLAGIILPFFFMTPFAIFFMRQFFLGISREVEESAKIDGAGHLRIFFRIVLPLSTPIVMPAASHQVRGGGRSSPG